MPEANFNFSTPIDQDKVMYRWQSDHFAEGGCRYAYAGRINKGAEKGTHIVVKKWIEKHIFDKSFWDSELKTHRKAKELIDARNDGNFINKKYVTHVPFKIKTVCVDKIYLKPNEKQVVVGEYVLGERYIAGDWQKWNSNSGYVALSSASVQAFCHWTYHHTDGALIMCDAQGVRTANEYHITDPCICSKSGTYGLTDCGAKSINSFFANHRCNEFCNSRWLKPTNINHSAVLPKKKTSTYRFEKVAKTKNFNRSNVSWGRPRFGFSSTGWSRMSTVYE